MYRPPYYYYYQEEDEQLVSTTLTTPTGELDSLLLTFPEEQFDVLTSSFSEVVNQQQQASSSSSSSSSNYQQFEELEEQQSVCALPLQQEAACLLELDLSSPSSSSYSSSPLHSMANGSGSGSGSGSPSQEDSSPWMDLLVTSPQTQSTFTSTQSEEVELFNSALELEGQHHQYGQLSPTLTYSSDPDSNTKTNTKQSRSTSTRKSKLTGNNIKSESKVVDNLLEDEEEFSKSKKGSANGRTRKRQRKGDATNENQDVSAVTLTRDQLLHFTSQDLDTLARNIANTRDLTTAEQKELKKQRRLIKNRESAQASRERKKMYVDELEGQINVLKMDNSKLMDEVKQLRNENLSLRDEVKTLHSFFKKSDNGDSQISFGNILSIKKPDNAVLTQKLKTAGVTLLIILFSFGLFFNNLGMMKSSLSPALSKILVEREEIPAVLTDSLGSMWSNPHLNPRLQRKLMSEPSPQYTSRSLKEKDQSPPSIEPEHIPHTEEAAQSATVLIGSPTLEEVRTAKRRDASPVYNFKPLGNQSYNFSLSDELSRKRRLVTLDKISQPDGESVGSIFMSEFSNESSSLGESKGADMVRWFNDNVQPKPNTAYMACSDVQQIIPTNNPPLDPNSPFFVSFLIPSSHTHNDSTSHPPTDNIMMEVTCQIVDISISHGFPQTPQDDSTRISV